MDQAQARTHFGKWRIAYSEDRLLATIPWTDNGKDKTSAIREHSEVSFQGQISW